MKQWQALVFYGYGDFIEERWCIYSVGYSMFDEEIGIIALHGVVEPMKLSGEPGSISI